MDKPGPDYAYDDLLALCARGEYPCAPLTAASGRRNVLVGLTPAQLGRIRDAAAERGLGALVMGSRVSGPRSRQRELAPVLVHVLPLVGTSRAPSATHAGADSGLSIDKTRIKDYGRRDLNSSDLGVMLLGGGRPEAELDAAAKALETEFESFTERFPIHVYGNLRGAYYADGEDFVGRICGKLAPKLPAGVGLDELKAGFREIVAVLSAPAPR